jgi:hypothetical protein
MSFSAIGDVALTPGPSPRGRGENTVFVEFINSRGNAKIGAINFPGKNSSSAGATLDDVIYDSSGFPDIATRACRGASAAATCGVW